MLLNRKRKTNTLHFYPTLTAVLLIGLWGCNAKYSEVNTNATNDVTEAGEAYLAEKGVDSSLWLPVNSVVKKDPDVERQVAKLMADMTLAQKVAQMIQPEIRDITPEDMRKYGFGSFLNGGGAFPSNNKHSTPEDWIALAEAMYQASIDDSMDGSTIPTMWGTDAVHGHNNVIGATLFPHNIGLGAANNPALITEIARVTATEVMVTGIDWVFAPTVATVRDDRWGRTYEGYSEDPDIVKAYASAIVEGLQGTPEDDFLGDNRVISTVKHFVGDGGTQEGDDQGNNVSSESDLYHIHAQGYVSGLAAGSQSVMASFNSWKGDKIHGNKYLLTDVLKKRMGFDGFVVGDWNGHGQVVNCSNESCPQAINAGLDIFMVPTDAWEPLYFNTIEQVKKGIIPMARIDDAVKRILRVKVRAGLFEKPSPKNRPFSGRTELIGHSEHREVAKRAVRESLVLLKNNDDILPLSRNQRVLVTGDAADNIGKQSGGWTITWQGTNNVNSEFPGGTSIFDGIRSKVGTTNIELSVDGSYQEKPDVAIVVFGEEPYAEGQGDIAHIDYQGVNGKDEQLLKSLQAQGIPVVSVFITGRPLWVNPEINASNAFVVAWLPGSEGDAVSDLLFKDDNGKSAYDFTGRLSFSWPKDPNQTLLNRGDKYYDPLFAYGYGLDYQHSTPNIPMLSEALQRQAIDSGSYPIYQGGVKAPYEMSLFSGQKTASVKASSLILAELSFRTIDRFVQEDGFRIDTQEGEWSGVRFLLSNSEHPSVLALNSQYQLKMDVRLLNASSQAIRLNLGCDVAGDNCLQSLDLKTQLTDNKEWQTLSVDMGCIDFARFRQQPIAIELASESKVSAMFHNIRLEKSETISSPADCNG